MTEVWIAEESGVREIPCQHIDDDPVSASALTNRQREVAVLLALGYTCQEVGERLGCSVKTADSHRGAVLRRLNLHGNADLARFALRRGG